MTKAVAAKPRTKWTVVQAELSPRRANPILSVRLLSASYHAEGPVNMDLVWRLYQWGILFHLGFDAGIIWTGASCVRSLR